VRARRDCGTRWTKKRSGCCVQTSRTASYFAKPRLRLTAHNTQHTTHDDTDLLVVRVRLSVVHCRHASLVRRRRRHAVRRRLRHASVVRRCTASTHHCSRGSRVGDLNCASVTLASCEPHNHRDTETQTQTQTHS
jgi:hypothetical protein